MLKFIPLKQDVLDVGDDLFPVGTKGFKDTVECSFAEWREREFGKHFRPVDPFVRPLYAEVIRQFVAGKSLKQIIDVDTPRLVFPENRGEIQGFIQPFNEEKGADRKGYILIRFNSNITKNTYISC